jgi:hypothetical protein
MGSNTQIKTSKILLNFFLVSLALWVIDLIDKFAFGMMNAKNTISFGLGVSLFLGSNILAFFTLYELYKSTLNKHFKNN